MHISQPSQTHHNCCSALIALGSNATSLWGDPASTILSALQHLENDSVKVVEISRLFANPAYPAGSGPDFVNACARIQTNLGPEALLTWLHQVEERAGRVRRKRWGARALDIDLLALDDLVRPDENSFLAWRDMAQVDQMTRAPSGLILPHPRLQDRAFVLVPLAELVPDWTHPVSGKSVRAMLNALPEGEKRAVKPVSEA